MAAESAQCSKQKDAGQPLTEEIMNNFKALGRSAFIVGYTGETGKVLTRLLHRSGLFKRIVLVGRRIVDYSQDPLLKDAEQVQVDFDKILEREDAFKDIDYGFSCLGSSAVKRGSAECMKVDREYAVNTARAARNAGVKYYSLVSAMGANDKSWSTQVKTKGIVEREIIQMGFENFTIMRPGALLCDRSESRPHETAVIWMMKPIFKIAPTRFSVTTEAMARAMLYRAIVPPNEPVDIVENSRIHQLAANAVNLAEAKQ